MSHTHAAITVRLATEADLADVEDMVRGFVAGHPAENHPRPISRLREAYFGAHPVAQLLVACRADRIVGMGQWTLIYDMFWSMFGGEIGPSSTTRPRGAFSDGFLNGHEVQPAIELVCDLAEEPHSLEAELLVQPE